MGERRNLADEPRDQQAMWEGYYASERSHDPEDASPFVARAWQAFAELGGRTVLELGCGLGMDAISLALQGMEVTALDFSASCLARLSARWQAQLSKSPDEAESGDIRCIEADLSQPLPFADGAFDAVYANLSLQYFDDATTRAIFGEIARVLKPSGLLAVCCKSIADPLYGQGVEIGPDTYSRQGHIRHFFREAYMRELLRDWAHITISRDSADYAQVAGRSAFVWAIARRDLSTSPARWRARPATTDRP